VIELQGRRYLDRVYTEIEGKADKGAYQEGL
jgi:hypothetical protein